MNQQLNPVIEKFYLSMLSYAGLSYDEAIIKNTNNDLGPITIDGKYLTLPYFDNLKNPNGRIIFHPLNENYVNPENTVFNFYKKRLVLELNLKLSYIIINLITVASDIQMQQKIKSSKLIDIISNIGETDMVLIENFAHLMRASKKVNSEAFLFDIFLKKNGEINGTPYGAIGKINFILANEIAKSLEEKDREYKVFGYKLRKKDLLALLNIFNILFPNFSDKTKYMEGTDNKIFRYLNILLKTSYMIAKRLNELCDLLEELKEPTLKLVDSYSDLDWVSTLEDLYGMATEIRLIPNQLDLAVESQHKLHIDESRAASAEAAQPASRTEFIPPVTTVQQPQVQQQTIQQQPQPKPLTAEDIIKGNLMMPNSPMAAMPGMMLSPQPFTQQFALPTWAQQEIMRSNMQQQGNMQSNIVMTPNGPAILTPSGYMPINTANMNMVPMNNSMMPMGGNMMPMNMNMMPGSMNMMPMAGNMTPMTGNMMPANTNITPTQGGIEPNPLFAGR